MCAFPSPFLSPLTAIGVLPTRYALPDASRSTYFKTIIQVWWKQKKQKQSQLPTESFCRVLTSTSGAPPWPSILQRPRHKGQFYPTPHEDKLDRQGNSVHRGITIHTLAFTAESTRRSVFGAIIRLSLSSGNACSRTALNDAPTAPRLFAVQEMHCEQDQGNDTGTKEDDWGREWLLERGHTRLR